MSNGSVEGLPVGMCGDEAEVMLGVFAGLDPEDCGPAPVGTVGFRGVLERRTINTRTQGYIQDGSSPTCLPLVILYLPCIWGGTTYMLFWFCSELLVEWDSSIERGTYVRLDEMVAGQFPDNIFCCWTTRFHHNCGTVRL
jgi:hypothetical protein